MEKVKCDLCGCENFKKTTTQTDIYHHVTDDYFDVVECENCKLMFTNPRPSEEEIGAYYSTKYDFHASKSKMKLFLLELIDKIANSSIAKLFSLVPFFNRKLVTYLKPKVDDPVKKYLKTANTLLDIGCGSGVSAHFWGKNGSLMYYKQFVDVYGVEISDDARKNLEEGGIKSFKSIDNVPIDLEFDIIRMNWSLEHVHSPQKFFQFIKQHLSKNGVAIIMVPNMDGLLYKIAIESVELPIHLYHFKKADIEKYAEKNDLAIGYFKTFSYPQMYRFLSEQNSNLDNIFADIKIDEAYYFQKILNRFDALDIGNDMLIELHHKK